MKEYAIEGSKEVDLHELIVPRIPSEEYNKIHENMIIVCHDIAIEYKGGILLVKIVVTLKPAVSVILSVLGWPSLKSIFIPTPDFASDPPKPEKGIFVQLVIKISKKIKRSLFNVGCYTPRGEAESATWLGVKRRS